MTTKIYSLKKFYCYHTERIQKIELTDNCVLALINIYYTNNVPKSAAIKNITANIDLYIFQLG